MILRLLFSFLLIFIFSPHGYSQKLTKYSRVKVFTNSVPNGLNRLNNLGLATDHGEIKKNVYFISDFSEEELILIKQNGFRYNILIEDVHKHYIDQNISSNLRNGSSVRNFCNNKITYPIPQNFSLGSMGGYFTLQEMNEHLDNMVSLYPDLISIKQSIGNSIEGRPIYYVKISNNPSIDQNKPEVFYNALHHAREAASLSQLIFYMWYLLENYNSNIEVKYLVDNLEMYFVPCINPDGYVYNENNYPSGGGMWRKNRKDNGDGTFGVDLNRNYGFLWGYDDSGSSPSPGSETYRGASAFSEPETQAIRDFCNSREFRIALNYHTYGNLLIYPWGYLPSYYTPDSSLFVNYAELLTKDNKYKYGTGDQTVNYVVNGDSDDWMYGEENSKAKIYSMTPEAGEGSDGFWPPSSRIEEICMVNVSQNMSMAHLAAKYAIAQDQSPAIFTEKKPFINFNIQRLGLDSAAFTVSIIPLHNVSSAGTSKTFPDLSLLETQTDSISITLSPTILDGETFSYSIAVNNGLYTHYDTITKIFGSPIVVMADNCNSMNKWESLSWDVSANTYFSPASSITDSPLDNYPNNANSTITSNQKIDLTSASSASLTFMAKWDIEAEYDFAQVLASSDSTTWVPLCGKYTHAGSTYQIEGEPVYDGTQEDWVKEEIDLKDFLGQTISLKFQLLSDDWSNKDGFYFDDLSVHITSNISGMSNQEEYFNLLQNHPNPASDYTYISFSPLNPSAKNKITIYNAIGSIIKEIPLHESIRSIRLNTAELPPGVYYYTLISDKNKGPIKKMIIVR